MDNDHRPLIWSEDFATGIGEIDEQHKILVDTLREAGETLGTDSSMATLDKITRDLLGYALYHFDTEERLMREYGYAAKSHGDAERHLEQHRAFSAKIVAVRDGLKSGKRISRDELLGFLSNWLANHILNTDKRLGAFIASTRDDARRLPPDAGDVAGSS